MKIIERNSIHNKGKSYDCLIFKIGEKILKLTYNAYNADEKCYTEIFDGNKWNVILNIWDLGVIPEDSAYNIWDADKRKKRADELFKKSEILVSKIIKP